MKQLLELLWPTVPLDGRTSPLQRQAALRLGLLATLPLLIGVAVHLMTSREYAHWAQAVVAGLRAVAAFVGTVSGMVVQVELFFTAHHLPVAGMAVLCLLLLCAHVRSAIGLYGIQLQQNITKEDFERANRLRDASGGLDCVAVAYCCVMAAGAAWSGVTKLVFGRAEPAGLADLADAGMRGACRRLLPTRDATRRARLGTEA